MRTRILPIALLAVAALGSACTSPGSPPPAPSRDLGPWKQVERGMTRDQVRGLLGEPSGFEWSDRDGRLLWHYPGEGMVAFYWTTTEVHGDGPYRVDRSDPQVGEVHSPRR